MKVFSRCPSKKMWQFSIAKDDKGTHFLLVYGLVHFITHRYSISIKCGVLHYCLFCYGLATTFFEIDESAPHFLFV